MEEIFKQSFNYAKIKLFKNYSNLRMKCVVYDSDEPSSGLPQPQLQAEVDPFDDLSSSFGAPRAINPKRHIVSTTPTDTSCHALVNLNLYKKNPRNFFYTTNPTDSFVNHAKRNHPTVHCDVVKLVNVKSIANGQYRPDFYEVTKDEQIKRHYNNPFASIEIYKVERWIKREGNKIKVKYFRQDKSRKVGSKYYRKNTSSVTITFDMVKGNFLIVTYESHKKKKTKHFYCNSFLSLEQALPNMLNIKEHTVSKLSPLHKLYEAKFDNIDFSTALTDALGVENHLTDIHYNVRAKEFVTSWMPKFAELKQIKLPNNGGRLLRLFYPTERYLKKNDRKLVAAILDRFGILSKLTVKILHENPTMDLRLLVRMCHLFGDNFSKYMGNVSSLLFTGSGDPYMMGDDMGSRHMLMENMTREKMDVTEKEKENMVHIINDLTANSQLQRINIIEQFYDHFIMLKRLRLYYPELSLNVRKWKTFTDEHSRISAMERNIKKGYSVHNIFENHILEAIEKPIEIITYPGKFLTNDFEELGDFVPQRDVYTPVLLRTSEQYVDEGDRKSVV